MTDIPIPPEAEAAGADEIATDNECAGKCERILRSCEGVPCKCAQLTRACFTAMVREWPGMTEKQPDEHVALLNANPALILPLTEQNDD